MFLTPYIVLTIFVIVILQIFNVFRKNTRFQKCLQEIPQPPTYPVVGNMFQFLQSPEKLFKQQRRWAHEYYPIFRVNMLHIHHVNIFTAEDIELLVSSGKHLSKSRIYDFLHPWLGTGLLTSTGAKWKSRRRILTPAFHFNILQEFLNIFIEESKTLVSDLNRECHKDYVDVIKPITHFTLLSISETAMGLTLDVPQKSRDDYKDSIYRLGYLITQRIGRPWIHPDPVYNMTSNGKEHTSIVTNLHEFTNKIIQTRKRQFSYSTRKRLAMLDLLLKYQAEGADIDEEGIREEVDTFLFEGHDTTSMSLCFTLMILANNRKIQDEIYQEMMEVVDDSKPPTYKELLDLNFMERCIKESLRIYPSVPFISRVTGEEIKTVSGYTIPKGCNVNVHIYDLHRNPDVFPDPEKFDPDRFLPENVKDRHPFAYLPFSAGPRNCIGQRFAILEIKVALYSILKNFILKPVDKLEDIVFIVDMVLRSHGSLKVKFVPRTQEKN